MTYSPRGASASGEFQTPSNTLLRLSSPLSVVLSSSRLSSRPCHSPTTVRPLHMSVSKRQNHGLWTLCLLFLAESVSLTNAVTFWNSYQQWSRHHGDGGSSHDESAFAQAARHAEECQAVDPSSTNACRNEQQPQPALAPAKLFPRARLAKRVSSPALKSPEACCKECSSCMDESSVERLCVNLIPRGGHASAAEQVAETIVEGATLRNQVLPYGIPLNGWKVIFQAFLTALNVFCWLVPLRMKKISDNKLALSLANAFSGGVFLSLAFGHLIPECIHGFEGYNEVTPFMLVLGGYLLIFFVEKVAFDTHDILHEMEGGDETHAFENGHDAAMPSGGRSAVILLAALGIHSILEMMALGLADTFGDSALLTLSISLHQPAESIALLVAFLKSGMPKAQIIQFLSIFSAMGPVGVGLGMAVNEFAAPIVDSIMLAVVAGTFVYVGATEVIPEEWEHSEHKWKKFASLLSGIASIFFITQYTMSLNIH